MRTDGLFPGSADLTRFAVWTWQMKLKIDRDYDGALSKHDEGQPDFDLRQSFDSWPVFLRLKELANLDINATRETLESEDSLPPDCVKSVGARLKHMYIFDYVRGYALAEWAAAVHGDASERKWEDAEEAYAKVLLRYPSGWHAFMHHGPSSQPPVLSHSDRCR